MEVRAGTPVVEQVPQQPRRRRRSSRRFRGSSFVWRRRVWRADGGLPGKLVKEAKNAVCEELKEDTSDNVVREALKKLDTNEERKEEIKMKLWTSCSRRRIGMDQSDGIRLQDRRGCPQDQSRGRRSLLTLRRAWAGGCGTTSFGGEGDGPDKRQNEATISRRASRTTSFSATRRPKRSRTPPSSRDSMTSTITSISRRPA